MSRRTAFAKAAAVAFLVTSCGADCNQEGCNALSSPASETGESSIAGVLAAVSDEVEGCAACGFRTARLEVWSARTPVVDEAGATTLAAAPPTLTIDAKERYRENLEPGSHLLCTIARSLVPFGTPPPVYQSCIGVEVQLVHVTTVSIELGDFPTRFFVFEPGSSGPAERTSFNVPR